MADLKDLVVAYQPSEQTLRAVARINLVAVVGPAGVGKTTIMKAAAEQDPKIQLVLSDTDRSARQGEVDGLDFYFRSHQTMVELMAKGAFVQVASVVTDNLYATRPESYAQVNHIAMMAIWADTVAHFRQLPFKTFRPIFIAPPNFKEWQRRLDSRSFSMEQREQRLIEAKKSYQFALTDEQTFLVINDDLGKAVTDLLQVAHGPISAKLVNSQAKARQIVRDITSQLA